MYRCEFKFVGSADPGTFEGYGSVFGNADDYGDVIQPGAFGGTLSRHRANGTLPKMLLNHGSRGAGMPMADLPIGKWLAMSEDSHGLQVKGRLINLDTERGKSIYGAMKEGALGGLSIGYRAGDYMRGTKPNEPRRTIKTIKDLIEVSLVTFPANELAMIGAVKAENAEPVREFESFLRDKGGFSYAAVQSIAENGFAPWREHSAAAELLEALRSVRALTSASRRPSP